MEFANQKGIKEEDKITIELEPMKLKAHVKEHYSSTGELSTTIARWVGSAFHDVKGAIVYVAQDGSYGLDIILQDLGEPEEGKFKAIIPVNKEPAKKDKYDAVSVLKSFNSRKAERVFELTEEFKAFIEKFVVTNAKARKQEGANKFGEPIWKNITVEVFDKWSNTTCVKIIGLDIFKVLGGLYGTRDENGSRYSYRIVTLLPINDNSPVPNFGLKIHQTTDRSVEEVAAKNNRCVQINSEVYCYGR